VILGIAMTRAGPARTSLAVANHGAAATATICDQRLEDVSSPTAEELATFFTSSHTRPAREPRTGHHLILLRATSPGSYAGESSQLGLRVRTRASLFLETAACGENLLVSRTASLQAAHAAAAAGRLVVATGSIASSHRSL